MGRKQEHNSSLAINLLVEHQQRKTRTQIELINGETIEGTLLGIDEHMNLTISTTECTILIPGKSIAAVSCPP